MAAAWEWMRPRLLRPLNNESQQGKQNRNGRLRNSRAALLLGRCYCLAGCYNRDAGLLFRIGAEFLVAVILEMNVLANALHQQDARRESHVAPVGSHSS